ncbi:MAG: biotin transporter BioY [Sedimentisphaerales bacterium]|nr:biotin transporter BioY [Sedimentisphaerales bacterium]
MLANATVADILRPCEKRYALVYDLALIIGGSLLIAVSAQIAIGFPVPITGQTFAVLMIAALLGSRRAVACVLTYLAEGAAGLPVFAQANAGLVVFRGFTAGYLVGFVVAAFVVGLLAEKGWDRTFGTTVLAMLIGNIIIYAFGLTWLSCLIGVRDAIAGGLYPFIPGDILKTVLAAVMLPSAWKLLAPSKPADPKSQSHTCRS